LLGWQSKKANYSQAEAEGRPSKISRSVSWQFYIPEFENIKAKIHSETWRCFRFENFEQCQIKSMRISDGKEVKGKGKGKCK